MLFLPFGSLVRWAVLRTGRYRAAEVALTTDVLDRIDEIVPPGAVFAERDTGSVSDAIADPALRRRVT